VKNRKGYVILIAVLLCVSIVFACLWIAEKKDHSELEDLCVVSAYRAHDRFSRYLDSGSAYDYAYGVAELESFLNSYMSLVVLETGSTDPNCVYLNQLIGRLMNQPELTQEQKKMLVSISAGLKENIYDLNVYDDVFALYNELTR